MCFPMYLPHAFLGRLCVFSTQHPIVLLFYTADKTNIFYFAKQYCVYALLSTSNFFFLVLISVHNQERVRHCGGVEILLTCLYRLVNRVHSDRDHLLCVRSIQCVANGLDSVITDHSQYPWASIIKDH